MELLISSSLVVPLWVVMTMMHHGISLASRVLVSPGK